MHSRRLKSITDQRPLANVYSCSVADLANGIRVGQAGWRGGGNLEGARPTSRDKLYLFYCRPHSYSGTRLTGYEGNALNAVKTLQTFGYHDTFCTTTTACVCILQYVMKSLTGTSPVRQDTDLQTQFSDLQRPPSMQPTLRRINI